MGPATRRLRAAILGLALAAAATAQVVEREVFLPDSFVGALYPMAACVPRAGRAYVAGRGGVPALVVVSTDSARRTGRVPLPEDAEQLVPGGVGAYAVGRNWLTGIDIDGDTARFSVQYGSGPGLGAVSRRDNCVWVASSLYGWVKKLYFASGAVVDSVRIDVTPTALLAVDHRRRLYVAGRQDTVVAIDAAGDSVIRRIPVGGEPSALCLDSAADRIYCANRTGSSVSVIDCSTNAVVATIPAAGSPVALALYEPLRKLYGANRSSGTVTVIDLNHGAVVATIPVQQPVALACSRTAGRLLVGSTGPNLAVVDCGGDTVIALLPVGANSAAPAFDRHHWLCAAQAAGALAVARGDSLAAMVQVATSGPRAGLVSGDRFYVAEERMNRVAVYGLPGFDRQAEIAVGHGPRALCAGDNGRVVYVACAGESLVCAIDADGDSVRSRIGVGNTPHHLAWDWFNNKVYCANYGGASVSVIDCAGDTEILRLPVGRACRRLAYSPVSNRIYAACHDGRCIDVINCASDSVVASIATGGNPWTVACDVADNLVYPGTSWGAPVICGWGDTVVAELSDPFYIKGIAWEPRSNTVYMARNFSSDVLVIDGAQHRVRRTLPTDDYPADMICLDSSGRAYVCHNRSGRTTGRLTVIDGDSVVAALDVRPSPVDVVADNASRRACVLSWESSCITLVAERPTGVAEDRPDDHGLRPTIMRVPPGGHEPAEVLYDCIGRRVSASARPAAGVYFAPQRDRPGCRTVVVR